MEIRGRKTPPRDGDSPVFNSVREVPRRTPVNRRNMSTSRIILLSLSLFVLGGCATFLAFRKLYHKTREEQRHLLVIPHSVESLKGLVDAVSSAKEDAWLSVLLLLPHVALRLYNNYDNFSDYVQIGSKVSQYPCTCVIVTNPTFAGSVFLNLLAGTLFGPLYGFALVFIICPIGASINYLLSYAFAGSLLERYFPNRLKYLRGKVDENREHLLYFLFFSRLFPFTPNWFLNFASPLVGIPFHLFFLSVMLGLAPYNFLCVQAGSTLSTIKTASDVLSGSSLVQMACLAVAVLLFGIIRNRMKRKALDKAIT